MSRIAFYLPHLDSGGAEKSVALLAGGMSQKGSNVQLVCVELRGSYLPSLPGTVQLINLQAANAYTSLPGLARFLRQNRPDVLISALDLTNLVALIARRVSGTSTRCLIQVHSTVSLHRRTWIKKVLERYLLALIYPMADWIVCVSNGVAQDLAAYASIPIERILTIYNPVITEQLHQYAQGPVDHPWFSPGSPPVLVATGRLSAPKDYPTLLRAFGMVRKQRDARLVILGEGEQRASIEAIAADIGISEHLALPGFTINPYAYMSKAAAFVLSSMREGLPTVLIEAMACGCPVVSTDCPSGPAEILSGGKFGHLTPTGDAESMAQAILAVLEGDKRHPPAVWLEQFEIKTILERYSRVIGI